MIYTLVQKGKVLFSSTRKLDTAFEHIKYKRRDKVTLRAATGTKARRAR